MWTPYINYDAIAEENRLDAFKHYVSAVKKQNADTVRIEDDVFSYTTKRGLTKRFQPIRSQKEKDYYSADVKVNGFRFREI